MEKKRLVICECDPGFVYEGPRRKEFGKNSGELFRTKYLVPFLEELKKDECSGVIDFLGTRGYMPSFLEESFGGAIRDGFSSQVLSLSFENLDSKERCEEIQKYINKALREKNGNRQIGINAFAYSD